MKTKECMHCETFFDCAGKPTDNPCLQFRKRKEKTENNFNEILQKEIRKE